MEASKLSGKTALVTGGGSGIGAEIAKLFAANGAFVIVIDNNLENANQVLGIIRENGGDGLAVKTDVSLQKEVTETVNEIAKMRTIDILVNNAGISHIGKLENTTEADFDRIFSVNVKGVYNMLLATVLHMKNAGGGVILNMASIAATRGIPDRFAYSVSKGAVFSMTLSVAVDYLGSNIRCNCISPARVHTPFVDNFLAKNYPGKEKEVFEKLSNTQPIGRMGKPEEVASLALFLCSDEASFITGCDYPIDGGFLNLAP